MKKIITLFILNIFVSAITFSNPSMKTMENINKMIQVSGSSSKTLSPNIAKITLTIDTENENLNTASKENSEILEKYKKLLSKTNSKYEKIESSDYSTYKNYIWENKPKNDKKEFQTTLDIEVDSFDLDLITPFINILTNEKILSVQNNINNNEISYNFEISETDENSKNSYQKAINKFNKIKEKLISKGFNANNIKISGYDNREITNNNTINVKNEKYHVSHSIEITTKDMKNLGNFITLANSLNIQTDGRIEYSIEDKEKIEDELYENAYKEALSKAENILKNTNIKLDKPINIIDHSRDIIRPYYSYYYSNINYNKNDNILEKSDDKIIEENSYNKLIINPPKSTFTKTVYIEFEMK